MEKTVESTSECDYTLFMITPLCNTPGETLPGDIFVSPRTTVPLPGTHCNTRFNPTNILLPRQLIWFPRWPMTIGLRDSLEQIRTDLTWKSLEFILSNQVEHGYSPPLLPEPGTSERFCQIRDVSEDILNISKDIVSFRSQILHWFT